MVVGTIFTENTVEGGRKGREGMWGERGRACRPKREPMYEYGDTSRSYSLDTRTHVELLKRTEGGVCVWGETGCV